MRVLNQRLDRLEGEFKDSLSNNPNLAFILLLKKLDLSEADKFLDLCGHNTPEGAPFVKAMQKKYKLPEVTIL